mmetsp:Transcript_31120/g.36666  ORF Transcript_31120/g.36666 Transcript_31120/m.36666 type:complete len:110 (-) Transcript_31120:197-526(-)
MGKDKTADCCLSCDDEGQCFGLVICHRQCGCFPCKCCAKDEDGHVCAVIAFCCQCDMLWPFCLCYRGLTCKLCATKENGGKGIFTGSGGAPAEEVTDVELAPTEMAIDR